MKRVGTGFIRSQTKVLAIAALVFLFAPRLVFSQGVVNFANTGTFETTADRRVYDPTTCAPMVGTNWVAALYFGVTPNAITELAVRALDDSSLLRAIGRFRNIDPSSEVAGTWAGGLRFLPGVVIGQSVTMQVRVWDLSKFATFDDAKAMGGYALESVPFGYQVPHAEDASGDKIHNFLGIMPPECVPEPSGFALAGLGLGILLALRRKPSKLCPRNTGQ